MLTTAGYTGYQLRKGRCTMTEQNIDDTEGHGSRHPGDEALGHEDDDTEGHGSRHPGDEALGDETDDVEGHGSRKP
jgi:hypothetical protein